MAWQIDFDPAALKELTRLGRSVARRIVQFLREPVASLDDPRSVGEALRGDQLGAFWKYRLGDYRVVAEIADRRIVIIVLLVGHRREVFRK